MTLEEYQANVPTDVSIKEESLAIASMMTPSLVDKYLVYATMENKVLQALKLQRQKLYKELWVYYSGKASSEIYKTQPLHLKILRQDLNTFIEADERMQVMEAKFIQQEAICTYLERTLKGIENRSYAIGNAITYLKWTTGGH